MLPSNLFVRAEDVLAAAVMRVGTSKAKQALDAKCAISDRADTALRLHNSAASQLRKQTVSRKAKERLVGRKRKVRQPALCGETWPALAIFEPPKRLGGAVNSLP